MSDTCKYHSGMLKQRAELQHAVESSLTGGATEYSYETYDEVWCAFIPLSGSEVLHAMRVDAQTRNRLLIRYRDDVRESDRVIIDNRIYTITYVMDVGYNHVWLMLDIDGGKPYAGG